MLTWVPGAGGALSAAVCPLPASSAIAETPATLASERPAILGANFARCLMSSTATGKAPINCAALAAAELQQPDYTPRPGAPAQQELGLPGLDFQPGLVAQRARLLLGRSGKRSGTDGFFDLNSRFGWGSGCTHRGWTLGSVLWWWTG